MPSNRKLKNSRNPNFFLWMYGEQNTERHKNDKLEYMKHKKKQQKQKTATQQRFKCSCTLLFFPIFVLFCSTSP